MCSPRVMATVYEAVSRRQFLGRLGAAGAATTLGGIALHPARVAGQNATPVAGSLATPSSGPLAGTAMLGTVTRVHDLSHIHSPTFPMFPGAQQMEINNLFTIASGGYYKNELILDEHTGTHMDAPAHFAAGGLTAELLPVEQLIAPLAVVDITERAASDPDTQLMPDDILAWEGAHGPLPAGAFVAMLSGWAERLVDPASFLNQDAAGVTHFPGFHPDAATFLVEERDIVGIGVDTISIDYGASQDFATHVTILAAGHFGIESLAALASVPATGATVIIGGPKHAGASGGPTRVIALS